MKSDDLIGIMVILKFNMDINDISKLRVFVQSAKLLNKILLWSPDESTAKFIYSVSEHWNEGWVAYFKDGSYVVLKNCKISDFIYGERLI